MDTKATQTENLPLPDGYYPRCTDSTPIDLRLNGGRPTVSRDIQTYTTIRRSSDRAACSSTSDETLPFSQNSILTHSDRGPSSTQDSPFDNSH